MITEVYSGRIKNTHKLEKEEIVRALVSFKTT